MKDLRKEGVRPATCEAVGEADPEIAMTGGGATTWDAAARSTALFRWLESL
jgi:hypothetical protein